jgi:radical SAM protein with 4Fe4S-binding SPASM domain
MNLTTAFRLFAAFSSRRLFNLLLNESSYYFSRLIHKPMMAGMPWAVSIEPTTHCNLRCPECPTGQKALTRPAGNMNLDVYRMSIDKISPELIYLTLYFQGEPLLNPGFVEMVKYAKQKRLFVSTSTNGHFLDKDNSRQIVESGLDRLIISVDGTDQETYSKYRVGGNLQTVLQGIQNIVYWKTTLKSRVPIVEIQFLVLGSNEHQLEDIRKIAKELKADFLSLKSAQLNSFTGNPYFTSMDEHSRYKLDEQGKITPKNKFPDHCHRLWHSPVITWDGKVVACCYDKNAEHFFGDLNETSFRSIWYSDDYILFRKQIFSDRKQINICRNCDEGI